jgi:DNA-binding MarR family transcriptional regulator
VITTNGHPRAICFPVDESEDLEAIPAAVWRARTADRPTLLPTRREESAETLSAEEVDRVRAFNRFYTRLLGLLDTRFMEGELGFSETRVLWEIGHRNECRPRDLTADLRLDRGYLSRLLEHLRQKGWVRRAQDPRDRRGTILALTPEGETALERLEDQARERILPLLGNLSREELVRLLAAMGTLESLLARDVR